MMCKVLQDTRLDALCIVTTVGQYNVQRLSESLISHIVEMITDELFT
jgi:hypothetical protein